MSYVITYSLEHYTEQTVMFFVAIIIGGIPMIFNNIKSQRINLKCILGFIASLMLVLFITFYSGVNNEILLTSLNLTDFFKLFIISR